MANTPPNLMVEIDFLTDPRESFLDAVFTMVADAAAYHYVDLTNVPDYIVQSGDCLEYEVYWLGNVPTLSVTGACALVGRDGAQKTSGGSAWNTAQAYSVESYVGTVPIQLQFHAGDATHDFMVGLNSDPLTDADYAGIDYAWYARGTGDTEIYESGVSKGVFSAYTANTVFLITYDGANVRYYLDGVLKRTVARATGAALFLDSSFYNVGARVSSVRFGTAAAVNHMTAADLVTSDALHLSDAAVPDQNGLSSLLTADLSGYASAAWYHRVIPLPAAWVGKTIAKYDLACAFRPGGGTIEAGFRDIAITDGSGVARQVIWARGDGPPSLFTDLTNPGGNSLAVSVKRPARTWSNVSRYALGHSLTRGRQNDLDRIETATETIRLNDDDRRFDPLNTASPYYPYVLPDRCVRVRAARGNLLADGGFESGALGTILPGGLSFGIIPEEIWAAVITLPNSSVSFATATPQSGTRYLSCTANASGAGTIRLQSDLIPVDPARPFALSLYLRKLAGSANPSATAQVECLGWDGTVLATIDSTTFNAVGGVNAIAAAIDPASGSWTRYGGSISPGQFPSGVVALRVVVYPIQSPSGAVTIGVDSCQVEQGAAISAFAAPVIYHRFRGVIERWPVSYGRRHAEIEVSANDGQGMLNQAVIPAKFYASALSGTQAAAILADAGWADAVSIDAGSATLQSWTSDGEVEGEAVARVQENADAELGLFYIDGSGVAVFEGRARRVTPALSVSAGTFSNEADVTGSAELLYLDPQPSFDEQRIVNHAAVRPAGATTWETADDLVSRRRYGRRSPNAIREPPISTDAEALSQAYLLLNRFKDPLWSLDAITLEPKRQDALWPMALGLDVSSRITVKFLPPGGGPTISRDLYIEAVNETVAFDRGSATFTWRTVWSLSAADTSTYWVLGDAVNGLLGVSTRLYA
jgi:hypothetical protein